MIGSAQLAATLHGGSFCIQLVWGLPPYYWFQVMTKFLQAQHILAPPVYIGLLANAINVLLNWLLIFHLGYGFDGAPIATSVCRWIQLALFAAYFWVWPERHRTTMPAALITRKKLAKYMPGFVRLAAPGAVMLLIEAWSFEITTILAAYLGTVALDAHLTVMQLATLSYLALPFAVAIASTIRIGNLLGAGDARRAEDAMYVTFAISIGFMAVMAVLFAALADYLGQAVQLKFRVESAWLQRLRLKYDPQIFQLCIQSPLAALHLGYVFTTDKEVLRAVAGQGMRLGDALNPH